MLDLSRERRRMVDVHLGRRGIQDREILAAMREVPREVFVDPGYEEFAYEDGPLPIAEGQTISQPYIVAFMLEMAEIGPTARTPPKPNGAADRCKDAAGNDTASGNTTSNMQNCDKYASGVSFTKALPLRGRAFLVHRFPPGRCRSHPAVRDIEAERVLRSVVAAWLAFMEIFVTRSLDAMIAVGDQLAGRKLVAILRFLHVRRRRLVAIHPRAAGRVVLPARRRLVRRCRDAEARQDTCRQRKPCPPAERTWPNGRCPFSQMLA